MASPGRGARQKGANFERTIAKQLSADLGLVFKRGLGQTRSALLEGGDVQCESLPQYHFELKHHKRVSISAAMKQAQRDCKDAAPVTITRSDREPILVTMLYEDWVKLMQLAYCQSEDHSVDAPQALRPSGPDDV
jgi:hypothetical protein